MRGRFDVVATNPPWGASVERADLIPEREGEGQTACAGLKRQGESAGQRRFFFRESFSLFLALGMECLRPGGRLSYLLPEAFLAVKRHENIRRFLLETCIIKNIFHLGKIFYKVTSEVIRLDAEKTVQVKISPEKKPELAPLHIDQHRFACNENAVFDVWTSTEDKAVLDKIMSRPHRTLADQAQWALGIVTGDTARFLSSEAESGAEGVLRGSDVSVVRVREPSRYLIFRPEGLQQVAPEALYRAPKLIYRFIAGRPVVAYDGGGRLTLNSANCVIPCLDDYPVRAVEALFNTRLYAYIFFHHCHSVKVLRAHLERLPLPLWPLAQLNELARMAEALSSAGMSEAKRGRLLAELEDEVMGGYDLSLRERERVDACVRV
jgi:hypothetical protein